MTRSASLLTIWLALGTIAAAAETLDYNRDIKPILAKNCFACHGPDDGHRSAGLRLDERDAAIKARKKGAALVPGKPTESQIIARVTASDDTERMPPPEAGDRLTPAQVELLSRWIREGAAYAPHWAFVKPQRPALPTVSDSTWPRGGIDHFILARLDRERLKPSPPADKFLLLRRTSLDLRGLPPSPEEVVAFANDPRPDAYERMVDRFLADPAYGERWARVWLDLARYADSAGYGSDPLRLNAWRFRDWVIGAFNANLPYDQFTVWQLAGDLLPNPTLDQLMATAFHRNTMTNTEGGTDDEEYRVAAVKDRVDTTFQVWMGLTAGCAKCHTHKYDPLTQTEYYRLFAVFNQTADADRGDESPTIPVPTPELQARLQQIDAHIAERMATLSKQTAALSGEQAAWEASLSPTMSGSPMTPPVEVKGDGPIKATLTMPIDLKGAVTGFRLTVHTDARLELTGLRLAVGADGKAPVARIVRVELPGNDRMLSLAEVEVFRGGKNIAPRGKATQSSTDYGGPPERAIDGKTDGNYQNNSVTHTRAEANPWWEVRLAEAGPVEQVVVWNRTDGGVGTRLAGARVQLLDESRTVVWQQELNEAPPIKASLTTGGPMPVNLVDAYSLTGATATPTALTVAANGSVVFIADKPVSLPPNGVLTFLGEARGVGRFTIEALTDARLTQRLTVPANVRAAVAVSPEKRTTAHTEAITAYYRTIAPALKPLRDEIAALEKSRPAVPTLPVMQELPPTQRRQTRVLVKGDFLNPGTPVEPGVPAAFHAITGPVDRLALARWIVSPDNPLTARVAVNRLWAQVFGKGLVETEEDFGTQGEWPSHPELLDWLATEFIRLGWDTKALLRQIVTSSTYRQTSRVTPELLKVDPQNRLLARAPRFRLEAEMVRDQVLAISGLLSRKVGGPSVYPPQPGGLWQAAFNGQRAYPTSTGEDRYRRGLYTIWRRTVPYPSMATFDAPSRETCAVKRTRTNTPLQAFVTLNDPVYVEAAQALARRMIREGGKTPEERVAFGLTLSLARPPLSGQGTPLVELFEMELARFKADPKRAAALATDPLGPLPAGMDAAEAAAWTVIANVLLNLDGVLTKG